MSKLKPWDEMSHKERAEQTFRDMKRKQLHRKRKAEEEAKAFVIERSIARSKIIKTRRRRSYRYE
ncbi:hypothetical protein [uncultured Clostridium sp.]|uniref:hypothetical protein n=1 Tax=uncultured Clostridium sp. TaxID=59620 RepID=UPI002609E4F6|nr:hypothetical protein [uncultured Clostridium sp.]